MSLQGTIEIYRAAHGEPEYRYFKKQVAWSSGRRGHPGDHITPISDGLEIPREEYEANVAEYEKNRRLAFLGKLPHSYWRYDQKMIKEGWREKLIKDVETFDTSTITPPHRAENIEQERQP